MTIDTAAAEGSEAGVAWRLARWLLIVFYLVAGIMHFRATASFLTVMPFWVPLPREVILFTGLAEIAGAIGLMTRRFRRAAGWALAAYAVCVYPANIQHTLNDLGGETGLSWWYHGPRLAAQPLIVWWALWASGVTAWPSRVTAAGRR